MTDIYDLLDRWGAWAASDSSGVYWQPVAAGFKGLIPDTRKCRVQTNDDEGIFIDSCVAKLRKHRHADYELVIAHFVLGISLRKIAKRRKCADGTVRKELQSAIGFIDGCICMFR